MRRTEQAGWRDSEWGGMRTSKRRACLPHSQPQFSPGPFSLSIALVNPSIPESVNPHNCQLYFFIFYFFTIVSFIGRLREWTLNLVSHKASLMATLHFSAQEDVRKPAMMKPWNWCGQEAAICQSLSAFGAGGGWHWPAACGPQAQASPEHLRAMTLGSPI